MLQLCGCVIPPEDVDTLIDLLEADVTLVSDEAAAAIRYARGSGDEVTDIHPDLRDAIIHVLDDSRITSLSSLRDALQAGSC